VNRLDYVVLIATILAIPLYGLWRTRGRKTLGYYIKGDESIRWATIGLSVLATQAGPITFLSMPGQAYESGIGFVQNYFGQPFALITVCAVFVPIFQRLKVYTAYEYLGQRFDQKTRLLGAFLFLIQRGNHHLCPGNYPLGTTWLAIEPNDLARRRASRRLYRVRWDENR
jgi:Na+/proline symporter